MRNGIRLLSDKERDGDSDMAVRQGTGTVAGVASAATEEGRGASVRAHWTNDFKAQKRSGVNMFFPISFLQ